MRKQDSTVASEMALEINGLIKKFIGKVWQALPTIKKELIEKIRKEFGLDVAKTIAKSKPADRPVKRKKKRAKRTVQATPETHKPVIWETIKPAQLTKRKRTKKAAVAPVEPVTVEQVEPVVAQQPKIAPPAKKPKLDRAARLKSIELVAPKHNAEHVNLAEKERLRQRIIVNKSRPKGKRHIPNIILKKREPQPEIWTNRSYEPTLQLSWQDEADSDQSIEEDE